MDFRNLEQLATAEYRTLCQFFNLTPTGRTDKLRGVGFTVVGEKDGERRVPKSETVEKPQ